ncbi:MAG: hypothetical protein ACR2JW_18440 [Thermomicrobiales bacterium]
MTTADENAIARAVDELLAVAGLTVNETERDYFVRAYPVLRESLRHLRIPEARDAEPALIYSADDRR